MVVSNLTPNPFPGREGAEKKSRDLTHRPLSLKGKGAQTGKSAASKSGATEESSHLYDGAIRWRKLERDFYSRPVLVVARDCIGKALVHRTPEGEAAGRIVEAEAYRGPQDLAAHSSRGLTRRTAAMYGPPGHAYVFRLYGVSWAFNLVVASEGEPHAVLIRALEPIAGIDLMAKRRNKPPHSRELSNGPGKLTHALAITGADYARDLCGDELFLADCDLPAGKIGRSPRINVDYAGRWAALPWRFYERGNRYVSVRPRD